jgi:hypothetical protein
MVKICTHHSFSKWQKLQLQSDKLLVQTPNLTKNGVWYGFYRNISRHIM